MVRVFFLITLLFLAYSHAATVVWAKDFKSAVSKAKQSDKPIVFIYSNHNCQYCVLLENTTLKDPLVVKTLTREFVSVVSYTDENDYTPEQLQTPGTPAIWFLYPNGEPMYNPIMGAIDAQNFLKALDIVKEEFKMNKKERKSK